MKCLWKYSDAVEIGRILKNNALTISNENQNVSCNQSLLRCWFLWFIFLMKWNLCTVKIIKILVNYLEIINEICRTETTLKEKEISLVSSTWVSPHILSYIHDLITTESKPECRIWSQRSFHPTRDALLIQFYRKLVNFINKQLIGEIIFILRNETAIAT